MAVAYRHLPRQHRTDGAVDVADLMLDAHRFAAFQCRSGGGDELIVQRAIQVVILLFAIMDRHAGLRHHLVQHARQVDALRLPVVDGVACIQLVHATDHLAEAAEAKLRHQFAHFLGDVEEEVDDAFRCTGEARAQHRVLRGDTDRTRIQVALAHHDAAGGNQRRGGEAELVGAKQGPDHHVAAGAQSAIHLHRDAPTQAVQYQRLLRLGQTDFPRRSGMRQRGQRRGASAAFETGDRHVIGARLRYAGGNRANSHFRHQLHGNPCLRIGVLQIVDELRQVLDRVDVVVRRRRNQTDTGSRIPHAGDVLVHLLARQLAAFAGLGALCHLDLQVVGVNQVFRGDAEPA